MSSSFPVSIRFQVEGDADVQSKLSALNQQVEETGNVASQATAPIEDLGESVEQTGTSAQAAQKSHVGLGTAIQNAAGGFALAAASAVSLWAAYDNVRDASKRVELAEIAQERAALRVSKAREALQKLQDSGTATALDLEQAQKTVTIAEANQGKVAFNLTNLQQALNKAWVQSATSIIPAVFTGISGLGSAYKALVPAMRGASGAAGGGRGGFGGVLRLLTSPLGIVIGIVGALAAGVWALRTNFMGVRDAVRGFIDWLKDVTNSIPFARQAIDWLVNGYKWLEDTLFGLLGRIPLVGGMFSDLSNKETGAKSATDLLRQGFDTLRNTLLALPAKIAAVAGSLWDGLANTSRQLYEAFTSGELQRQAEAGIRWLFDQLSAIFGPIGQTLWNGLVDTATWISTTLQDPVFQTQFLQGLRNFAEGVNSLYTQIGETLWAGLVNTARWIYNTLTDPVFLQQASEGILQLFRDIDQWFRTNVVPIAQQMWGALVSAGQALYDVIVNEFYPWARDGLIWLFGEISRFITTNAPIVGQFLYDGLLAAGKFLYDVVVVEFYPWARDGLTWLFGQIQSFVNANAPLVAQYLYNGLVMAGQGIWDGIKALAPLAQSAWNWFAANIGPWFTSAIVGLGLYLHNALITEVYTDLWSALTVDLPNAIQGALNTWPGRIGAMLGTALGTFGALLIQGLAAGTTDLPNRLTTFFNETLPKVLGAVAQFFTDLFTNPAGVSKGVTDGVAAIPQKVQDAFAGVNFHDAFGKAFGEAFAKAGGAEAYASLVGNVNSILNWINQGIQALPGKVAEGFRGAAGAFVSGIKGAFNTIVGQLGTPLRDAIIGGANSLLAFIKEGITQLPAKIADAITKLPFDAIKGAIQGLFGKAAGGLLDLFNLTSAKGGPQGPQPAAFQPGGFRPGVDVTTDRGGAPAGAGGFDVAPINAYKTALTGLLTHFKSIITQMAVGWTGHATMVGTLVNAVGQHLGRLAQGYILLVNAVATTITQMAVGWAGHGAAVGAAVNATGQHLGRLAQGYTLLLNAVQTVVTQMAVAWNGHAQAVGGFVNRTGQQLGKLAQGYVLLVRAAQQSMSTMAGAWSQHAGQVNGLVNRTGQALGRLAQGYTLLVRAVQQTLSQATNAWRQHASAVSNAVNTASSRVRSLASAVSSSMSRISSSMRTATSAANNLRAAISRLQSRNITITTRYRTIGSPAGGVRRAAKGFSGVVSQPTRLFVGEGNKPELVQVMPLSAAGGRVDANKTASAATGGGKMANMFQQPTIRSGLSTGLMGTAGTAVKKIFKDTIEDWIDKFGYEVNKFKRAANGMVKFEIAGGRHYKLIQQDRAARFAASRGYSLSSYQRRNTRDNHYLNMQMNPGMMGGGGGGGGGPRETRGLGFVGAGAMRALKYITSGPNLNKGIQNIQFYEDGTGRIYYTDGTSDRLRHNHPGPFTTGMVRAAGGFSGVVSNPTKFLAGEGGREFVNIQPLSQGMGRRGGGGGAGAGGRPVVIQLNIKSELDGRVISESVRKELLGGIYSMT